MIKEVKILEVHVDKGMKHGQRITFTGEADQAPGVEPGDIVLLLQEKEHEVISFLFYFCLRRSEMGLVCKIQVGDGFVAKSCPTLCNPMNRSTPGLPVHHQLPEFTQTHVH